MKYRVYQPWIATNQKKYVNDALDSNELTFRGKYEQKFANALANYLDVKHVILTTSGTSALYAAYREVFNFTPKCFIAVPTITYAATISQLKLLGFTPLYIDCDENFQVNLEQIEKACKLGVQGVVIANLYADAPNMIELTQICEKYSIPLIEDAAEAFGCWNKVETKASQQLGEGYLDYKSIGTYGKVGTFSFFANKVITSGEGGCIVTNDDILAEKVRKFCNHNTAGGYKHDGLGCNFRMTNLQAAIGLAQLEDIYEITRQKRLIAEYYRSKIKFESIKPKVSISSEWLPLFKLKKASYPKFLEYCTKNGVEVRPSFYPIHEMKEYEGYCPFSLDKALDSKDKHFILPSYPSLLNERTDKELFNLDYSSLIEIIDIVNKFEE